MFGLSVLCNMCVSSVEESKEKRGLLLCEMFESETISVGYVCAFSVHGRK